MNKVEVPAYLTWVSCDSGIVRQVGGTWGGRIETSVTSCFQGCIRLHHHIHLHSLISLSSRGRGEYGCMEWTVHGTHGTKIKLTCKTSTASGEVPNWTYLLT